MSGGSGEGGVGGAGGAADDKKRQHLRQSYDEEIRQVMHTADWMNKTLKRKLQLEEEILSLQAQLPEAREELERTKKTVRCFEASLQQARRVTKTETARADAAVEESTQLQAKLYEMKAEADKAKADARIRRKQAHDHWDRIYTQLQQEHTNLQEQLQAALEANSAKPVQRKQVPIDLTSDDDDHIVQTAAVRAAAPAAAHAAAPAAARNMLHGAPVMQSGSAAGSVSGNASDEMEVDKRPVTVLTASDASATDASRAPQDAVQKSGESPSNGEPSKKLAFTDGKWHPEVKLSLEELEKGISADGERKVKIWENRFQEQNLTAEARTALRELPYEITLVALGKVWSEMTALRDISAFIVKQVAYLRNQWGLDDVDDGKSSSGEGETESETDEGTPAPSESGGAGALGGAARDDALAAAARDTTRPIEREPGNVYVMSEEELEVKYTLDPTKPNPANQPRDGYTELFDSRQNARVPAKWCWGCFDILGKNKNDLDNPKAQCRRCNSKTCKKNRQAFMARRAAAKKAPSEQVPARAAFSFEDPGPGQ